MESLDYIPADPDLLTVLDASFAQERQELDFNIRATREIGPAEEDDDEPQHVHTDSGMDADEPYEPEPEPDTLEQLEYARGRIDILWKSARDDLAKLRTAQQQIERLDYLLRESFADTCYTGNSPTMLRFFDRLIKDIAEKYEPQALEPEGMSGENVQRLGTPPKEYIAGKLGAMCDYTDMTIDAANDIVSLTTLYEATHGYADEEAAQTPHDVIFRRYCKARDIDPFEFDMIPPDEEAKFLDDERKFYLDELFRPFNEALPEKVSFEFAWFLGAAIEAIRKEERGEQPPAEIIHPREVKAANDHDERGDDTVGAAGNSILERLLPEHATEALTAVNDNAGERTISFAAAEMARRNKQARPHRDRSITEIMNDPEAVARIHDMLSETFDDFPEAATSIERLVDAKNYFHEMFLGGEYAARAQEGPAR